VTPAAAASVPGSPTGGPATPPKVGPWLAVYTLGRLAIAAALVAVLWLVGLGSFPGLLFGLLLSMPASYVLLRPVRDRLTEALAARSTQRKARKENLRARLSGEGDTPA
jgi:membrane protein implicated in regulation of membrane protease activity